MIYPPMVYSENGLNNTEHWEGLELVAYPDPGSGGKPWTIGYGHTKGVVPGMTCTKAQAEQWLKEDIQWASDAVNKNVNVPIDQSQFDALVDFTFNVGATAFSNSTLLKKLNEQKYDEVDEELMRWVFASGKKLTGLVSRRQAGAELFDDHPPVPGEDGYMMSKEEAPSVKSTSTTTEIKVEEEDFFTSFGKIWKKIFSNPSTKIKVNNPDQPGLA